MGAPIAEADQGIWMLHHVRDRIQVAIGVIGERAIQDCLAVVFQQDVIADFFWRPAFTFGLSSDGFLWRWFLVGLITEWEDAAP